MTTSIKNRRRRHRHWQFWLPLGVFTQCWLSASWGSLS